MLDGFGEGFNRGYKRKMSEGTSSSGGISFIGLLTILFIGLKLTGFIDWSWLWVLSPLWVGGIIMIVILGVALAFIAWDK
jgi:hypothetical protein